MKKYFNLVILFILLGFVTSDARMNVMVLGGGSGEASATTTLEASWAADFVSTSVCYPDDAADWVGWQDNKEWRVAQEWDISSINSSWDITKVEVRVYVETVVGSPDGMRINRYGTSHGEDDASDGCSGIDGDGYGKIVGLNYIDPITDNGTGAWTDWADLGATAASDIEWIRDNAFTTYAVGMDNDDTVNGNYYPLTKHAATNDAELKITYNY